MESEHTYFSSANFSEAFDRLKGGLYLPETEESWEKIYHCLKGVERLCKERGGEHPEILSYFIHSVHRNISNALSSERTRLSGAALDLLTEVAVALNMEFEPLSPLFLPILLQLCGRTNKVVASRAKACILTIIETTQLPGILNHLAHFVKDKSPSIRLVVVEGTLLCLKCFNPPDLEKEPRSRDVEHVIRMAIRDANADVRRTGKDVFESFKVLLPNRVDSFAASLSPAKKKYLPLDTKANQKPKHAQQKILSINVQASGISKSEPTSQDHMKTTDIQRPVRTVRDPEPPLRSTSFTDGCKVAAVRPVPLPIKASQHRTAINSASKVPATFIRPSTLSTLSSSGPRRVLAESSTSIAAGPLSSDKTIKPSRIKTDPRSSYSRGAMTNSHIHRSTSSRANETSSNPKPQADEANTRKGVPHKINRMRDLTRPTLSQLARAKATIVKEPTTKPLEKLVIRKGPSMTDKKSIATRSTKSETQSVVARQLKPEAKRVRPLNPAAVPLPPSPTPPTIVIASTGDVVEEKASKYDVVSDGKVLNHQIEPDEGLIVDANHTALADKTNTQEDIASTPITVNNAVSLNLSCKTPISALLASIQQGFDMTPCSPLSPPQHYVQGWDSSDTPSFKLGVGDMALAITDP